MLFFKFIWKSIKHKVCCRGDEFTHFWIPLKILINYLVFWARIQKRALMIKRVVDGFLLDLNIKKHRTVTSSYCQSLTNTRATGRSASCCILARISNILYIELFFQDVKENWSTSFKHQRSKIEIKSNGKKKKKTAKKSNHQSFIIIFDIKLSFASESEKDVLLLWKKALLSQMPSSRIIGNFPLF